MNMPRLILTCALVALGLTIGNFAWCAFGDRALIVALERSYFQLMAILCVVVVAWATKAR